MNLRELREQKGLSQLDVAVATGVTPSTYWNWESGKRLPRNKQLVLLAKLFDMDRESMKALIEQEMVKANGAGQE